MAGYVHPENGSGSALSIASRIACLLVKNFALAAQLRINPELRETPLAISISTTTRAPLCEVSTAARRAGVFPGMTKAQARAVLPDLMVNPRSEAVERAAADALLDAANSFSPLIEDAAPGRVYLDLTGLGRLYGTESQMALELTRRVRQVGMEAEVGIAAGKDLAYLAARCGGTRIIDAGHETEFLQWLPLELLEIDPELELRMERLGIRRLGDLARFDARELGSRLGAGALELSLLLRGRNGAPLRARAPAEIFAEGQQFDYAFETLEPLGFILRGLLERLTARLRLRHLVAGDIVVSMELTGHRRDERRVPIAAATNEVRALLALLLLDLEKNPPAAGVEAIMLAIQARAPRQAQTDLFLPPAPAPERLQTTLAHLAALYGPDQVGALLPANSHRPEALERVDFTPPPPAAVVRPTPVEFTRPMLRAVRPPQEVEVLLSRGQPEFVRGEQIGARVVSIAGPWRRQGEWWRTAADGATLDNPCQTGGFARDYYEMALADGGIYRLFHDLVNARWFLDGVYD